MTGNEQTGDRASLVLWFDGILLTRDERGVRVCNELAVERALAAIERGESVLLIDRDGRAISRARLIGGVIAEESL